MFEQLEVFRVDVTDRFQAGRYKARDVASMMLEGQNTADELVEGSRRAHCHTHCDGLLLGANGLALGDANGLVLGGTRVP